MVLRNYLETIWKVFGKYLESRRIELLQKMQQVKGAEQMTNAEHIQMLSKWDLAEFIYNVSNNDIKITTCKEECAKCEYSDSYCTFQIAEWLNQQIGANE